MIERDFNEALIKGILERKDLLPGGLADEANESDFDPEQLKMGVKSELEHTSDKALAKEIAMDHLKEDPKYYSKLEKMEESKNPITEKSHYALKKTAAGKKTVNKEYDKHKKTRNSTGAAIDQNARVRKTKRGKQMAKGRDAARNMDRPETCPKCKKKPGRTSDGKGKGGTLSNMIWDHTEGYGDDNLKKGQFMCRDCHNKKDNNKTGDKSVKGKRRTKSLKSIDKNVGDLQINKATHAESKSKATPELIDFVAQNMFTIDQEEGEEETSPLELDF